MFVLVVLNGSVRFVDALLFQSLCLFVGSPSFGVLSCYIDGVVLSLVYLLDIAVLKSLPFLGMMPCVDYGQGLSFGVSGRSSLS